MAEEEAAVHGAQHGGKQMGKFLAQKVGPLPMGVWLAIGLVIIIYIKEKQGGGGLTSLFGGSSSTAVPNQQTDPAGNIGTIDPATGYVYGTPEDTAALAANNDTSGTTSNGVPAPTAQTYADNNAWGRAAVNYLVGLGTDPTQANEAVQQYLASQQLTTQQQGDINLAIQALGPPPQLPGPIGTPPGPVTTPPGTGTAVVPNEVGKSAGTAHNDLVAAGFVPTADPGQKATDKVTSTTPAGGTTQPKGTRVLITASATSGGGTGGGGTHTYTVVKGDTLSGIAAKFKYPGGWQALYAKNRAVIGGNPNLIKPGQVLQV